MSKRKKIGLALGSGAYRGFAHIGVIRSFEKHGIPIDYLSGSSIGAWIAAYYALFQDTTALEDDLTKNSRENMSLLLDFNWSGGLIGGNKFTKYLDKKLQGHSFAETNIPLRIVATDLRTARPYIFSRGNLATAVRASTSVPIVFKPIEHDSCLLADGGMSNPVPGDLVREMGADVVIGVNLYHQNEFRRDRLNLSQLLVRSTAIMLHNLADASLDVCDAIISPDLSVFGPKSSLAKYFDQKMAREMIKTGYDAAESIIPHIKKLL